MKLVSVDVHLKVGDCISVVNATVQEAFQLLTMPAFAGDIVMMVPCYELSEMPEE